MKKIIAILIVTMVLVLSLGGCTGDRFEKLPTESTLEGVLERDGYSMILEDNFDGDAIDSRYWKVGYGDKARRAAYYTEDSVFVKDGALTIRTNYRKDGVYGEGWYTGWVESSSRDGGHGGKPSENYEGISRTYGYFEVRCKVPATTGIWSAFWLMPDNGRGAKGMRRDDIIGTGTDGVEIDVMESFYNNYLGHRNGNQHVIHGDGYGDNAVSIASPKYDLNSSVYDEFHDYGLMWTEDEYIFYVDGRETWRTRYEIDGEARGISQVDEYMLLTIEVAGEYDVDDNGNITLYPGKMRENGEFVNHWAGNPNSNNKSKNYDFVIDRVRVFARA